MKMSLHKMGSDSGSAACSSISTGQESKHGAIGTAGLTCRTSEVMLRRREANRYRVRHTAPVIRSTMIPRTAKRVRGPGLPRGVVFGLAIFDMNT